MKRWIFFLSYIVFFTAVPICVFYFWPVKTPNIFQDLDAYRNNFIENPRQPTLNADSTADSINPYLSIDLHWQDSVKHIADSINPPDNSHVVSPTEEKEYDQLMVNSFDSVLKVFPFSIAVLFCFLISILSALILAIRKFARPGERTGWVIAGISVFNLLYLPAMMYFILFKAGGLSWYGLLPVMELMETTGGMIFGILLLAIYLVTIALAVIGTMKAKTIEPGK
ncbi:MAG TPA: hypothetical protein VL651_05905 [Bacteroidia bacterium]|nr:hypothetical protein [Bacteroidia bacterium]